MKTLGPYTSFKQIPQFTEFGNYTVTVPWNAIERQLESFGEGTGIDLDPDFQRGHVWTELQQVRFVEFILRGGRSGKDILFNQPSWRSGPIRDDEPMQLVDGKQRLQAARRFMNGEIRAFGTLRSEFAEARLPLNVHFDFTVNDLKTRAEVLQWYLDLNDGGVVHASEEIARVRGLLAAERGDG